MRGRPLAAGRLQRSGRTPKRLRTTRHWQAPPCCIDQISSTGTPRYSCSRSSAAIKRALRNLIAVAKAFSRGAAELVVEPIQSRRTVTVSFPNDDPRDYPDISRRDDHTRVANQTRSTTSSLGSKPTWARQRVFRNTSQRISIGHSSRSTSNTSRPVIQPAYQLVGGQAPSGR